MYDIAIDSRAAELGTSREQLELENDLADGQFASPEIYKVFLREEEEVESDALRDVPLVEPISDDELLMNGI